MHTDTFFRYLKYEKRISDHTLVAYKNDIKQYQAFLIKDFETENIDDVSHTLIRSWIVSLMEQGLNPRSVNRKITTLKTYYKFLMREGVIVKNPMLKIQSPKTAKRLPEFIEESGLDKLFDQEDFTDDFEGLRDRLIILLLYSTGIRLSELVGLKEMDVDMNSKTIKVLGKRNKQRIVPVDQELLELLSNYQNKAKEIKNTESNNYLFLLINGKQIYPKLVYQVVTQNLAKITTAKKKSPHILRHSFATHLLNNGADLNAIKELLGHSSLAATQVYTHNSIEKLKNIYKQAHPRG